MDPAKVVVPVLRGHLLADISYVGFPISPSDIGKYFFVIEEHMTEPRFGFDSQNYRFSSSACIRKNSMR